MQTWPSLTAIFDYYGVDEAGIGVFRVGLTLGARFGGVKADSPRSGWTCFFTWQPFDRLCHFSALVAKQRQSTAEWSKGQLR